MAQFKTSALPVFTGKKKKFLDLLLEQRERVLSNMQYHAEDALSVENSDKRGVTTHMADQGSDNWRHDMELQMLSEDGDVLRLIEDAIDRLINDKYGKCFDCGKPIPEARLEVRPYAIYCTNCKSIREKHHGFNPNISR